MSLCGSSFTRAHAMAFNVTSIKKEKAASNDTEETSTVSETITFSELGYDNGDNLDKISGENITLDFDANGVIYVPRYYDEGEAARLYGQNSLSFISDYTIVEIDFTYVSNSSYIPKKSNCTFDVGSYNYSTYVWTGEANEIVMTNTASSGHFRIKSVTVTYEAGDSSDGIEDGDDNDSDGDNDGNAGEEDGEDGDSSDDSEDPDNENNGNTGNGNDGSDGDNDENAGEEDGDSSDGSDDPDNENSGNTGNGNDGSDGDNDENTGEEDGEDSDSSDGSEDPDNENNGNTGNGNDGSEGDNDGNAGEEDGEDGDSSDGSEDPDNENNGNTGNGNDGSEGDNDENAEEEDGDISDGSEDPDNENSGDAGNGNDGSDGDSDENTGEEDGEDGDNSDGSDDPDNENSGDAGNGNDGSDGDNDENTGEEDGDNPDGSDNEDSDDNAGEEDGDSSNGSDDSDNEGSGDAWNGDDNNIDNENNGESSDDEATAESITATVTTSADTITLGGNVTLTVAVDGIGEDTEILYKWFYYNDSTDNNAASIDGANEQVLVFTPDEGTGGAGSYYIFCAINYGEGITELNSDTVCVVVIEGNEEDADESGEPGESGGYPEEVGTITVEPEDSSTIARLDTVKITFASFESMSYEATPRIYYITEDGTETWLTENDYGISPVVTSEGNTVTVALEDTAIVTAGRYKIRFDIVNFTPDKGLTWLSDERGTYMYLNYTVEPVDEDTDDTTGPEADDDSSASDGTDNGNGNSSSIHGAKAAAEETYTVYTTSGTRVMTAAEASEVRSLPAGTYIVNGKKIAIK